MMTALKMKRVKFHLFLRMIYAITLHSDQQKSPDRTVMSRSTGWGVSRSQLSTNTHIRLKI